jgi:catalase
MADKDLQELMDVFEEKFLSLERRIIALQRILPPDGMELYNNEMYKMREETGDTYTVQFKIETDKGIKTTKPTEVKAWSVRDAHFIHWDRVVYPSLKKMKEDGVIRYFKNVK